MADQAKTSAKRARDTDKPSSGRRPKRDQRFWLKIGGHETPLRQGKYLLGRGANCHVKLQSRIVSREHAALHVLDDKLILEDLKSRNGVYINGKRISGETAITGPVTIRIADVDVPIAVKSDARRQAPTQTDLRQVSHAVTPAEFDDVTLRASSFELLGEVVRKALALGRADEAEHLLTGHLAMFLTEAEGGLNHSPDVRAAAAGHAVTLARATGKAGWVDYCFKLYLAAAVVMPQEIVDELYQAVRKAPAVDRALLEKYLSKMQAGAQGLTPNDRFALHRLEGLMRLTNHL